jgi:hypothetical protein
LNALRWRLWDHFYAGRPPSRIQGKTGTLGIVNEDGTVTERTLEGYLRPVPTLTGG